VDRPWRLPRFAVAAILLAGPVTAGGRGPHYAIAHAPLIKEIFKSFVAAVTGSVSVTPSTITFNSPDPDTTPVSGSTAGTVMWSMNGGNLGWSMTVSAAAASFTGCPAVPLSAVQFSCGSVTPGGGGNPNGSCSAGTFTLSTTPQTIASGTKQGNGSSPFSATVTFTFTDAWKYPASSSCSIQLNYSVTAQ
jgi:hypothetical protein